MKEAAKKGKGDAPKKKTAPKKEEKKAAPAAGGAAAAAAPPRGEQFSFPKTEEKIMQFWTEIDAFQTSLKMSEGKKEFTFYDGPPFATGESSL